LKNNYNMYVTEFTRNKHQNHMWQCIIHMRINKFTCESPKHKSLWLNFCVFHRWPRGIYIVSHTDDNLKYIITREASQYYNMWSSGLTCEHLEPNTTVNINQAHTFARTDYMCDRVVSPVMNLWSTFGSMPPSLISHSPRQKAVFRSVQSCCLISKTEV